MSNRGNLLLVTIASYSHPGRQKQSVDSHVKWRDPDAREGVRAAIAIAEGLDGDLGGIASATACNALIQTLHRCKNLNPSAILRESYDTAHKAVARVRASSESQARVGTTFTTVIVSDNGFHVGHIGDSRLYHVREGSVWQLTRDHVWAVEAVERGVIWVPRRATQLPELPSIEQPPQSEVVCPLSERFLRYRPLLIGLVALFLGTCLVTWKACERYQKPVPPEHMHPSRRIPDHPSQPTPAPNVPSTKGIRTIRSRALPNTHSPDAKSRPTPASPVGEPEDTRREATVVSSPSATGADGRGKSVTPSSREHAKAIRSSTQTPSPVSRQAAKARQPQPAGPESSRSVSTSPTTATKPNGKKKTPLPSITIQNRVPITPIRIAPPTKSPESAVADTEVQTTPTTITSPP